MRSRWLLVVALLAGCSTTAAPHEVLHPKVVLAVREAATGTVRWTRELDHTTAGADVALYDGRLLLGSGDGYVAQDLRDGHELWTAPGAQLPAVRLPGLLVERVAAGVEGRGPDGRVRWRRTTSAQLVPSTTAVLTVTPVPGSPVGSRTTLTRLDPATGRDLWSVTLAGLTGAAAEVSPANVVVAVQGNEDGVTQTLIGLSAQDGRRLWHRQTELVTAAAADGSALVLQSAKGGDVAVRMDPLTGREIWSAPEFDAHFGQPFLATERHGERFVAYRLDPATGARVPGNVSLTLGAAASGDLLVGADDVQVTALRGAVRAWVSRLPSGVRPATTLATDGAFVVTVTATGFPAAHD